MVAAPVAVSTSPQMASVPSAEATAAWAPETKNCGKPRPVSQRPDTMMPSMSTNAPTPARHPPPACIAIEVPSTDNPTSASHVGHRGGIRSTATRALTALVMSRTPCTRSSTIWFARARRSRSEPSDCTVRTFTSGGWSDGAYWIVTELPEKSRSSGARFHFVDTATTAVSTLRVSAPEASITSARSRQKSTICTGEYCSRDRVSGVTSS